MTMFFKTLRNHWKKTTAGICLLTWGGHWLYGKHCSLAAVAVVDRGSGDHSQNTVRTTEVEEMTLFAEGKSVASAAVSTVERIIVADANMNPSPDEHSLGPRIHVLLSRLHIFLLGDMSPRAEKINIPHVFGNQLIPPNAQVKKATVFLNPAACRGKARTLFEKNAAPILHLSGMDVTIVKTDYEGQAKKLLELMENTDVIIVAGGDGTLQEVITGVLRRADEATFSKIPIGFIPLGQTSSLSQTLFAESGNKVQHITDATLAIVKGETVPLDVLQIKGEKEQPVFAMTGLRWGSFRDAGVKVSKYWYLGPLKTKAAHFFSTLKEWPQTHQASILYTEPTERPPSGAEEAPPRPSVYRRTLRRLAAFWARPQDALSQEVSPEVWKEVQLSAIELSIMTRNSQPDLMGKDDFMNICIEPDTISKGDFITVGSKRVRNPRLRADGAQCLQASQCALRLPEGTGGSFSIDSEEYEATPVEVKLLPRKLHFFCDPRKRPQVLQSAAP